MVSTVPKPAPRGHRLDGASPASSAMRALSTRAPRRRRPASCPPRGAKARAKLRSLMWARSASAGTDRSASRLSAIQACSSRSGRRSASCAVELGAELGLAARALDEEHEPARRGQRRLAAEVLLHQCERQVHPGRHARRGVHVAVAHEDRVRVHLDARVALGEQRAARPVGGGAAARPAGPRSQQEGAGADAGHPARAAGRSRSASRKRSSSSRATTPVPPATTRVSIGPRTAASAESTARLTADALSAPGVGRNHLDLVGAPLQAGRRCGTPRPARPRRAAGRPGRPRSRLCG